MKKKEKGGKLFRYIAKLRLERANNTLGLVRDGAYVALGFLFGGCHVIFGAHPLGLAYVCLLERGAWLGLAGVALGSLTLGKEGIIYLLISLLTLLLRVVISSGEPGTGQELAADGQGGDSAIFSERLPLKMSVAALGGFVTAAYELILGGVNYTTLLFGICMLLIPPFAVLLLSGVFCQRIISLESLVFGKHNPLTSRGKDGKELFDGVLFKTSALVLIFLISFSLKKYSIFGIDLSFVFVAFATLFICRRFGAAYGLFCGFSGALAVSALYAAAFAIMGAAAGLLFPFGTLYALSGGCIALSAFGAYAEGVLGLVSLLPEYLMGASVIFPILGHIERVQNEVGGEASDRVCEDMVGTMALSYQNRAAGELEELEGALHGIARLAESFDDAGGYGEYGIAARFISESRAASSALRDEDEELRGKLEEYVAGVDLKGFCVGAFGGRSKYIIIAGEDRVGDIMTSADFIKGLSAVAGIRLGTPEYYRRGSVAMMVTASAPTLSVESAIATLPGDSGEVSGDHAVTKIYKNHTACALVADGMGSGADAGEVARFCCDFVSGILGTGVEEETVFHALNSIIGKRREECSVALDLFSLDLLSGEASFIKSGATFSYIKRHGSLFRLRSATMPLGVIKQVDAEKITAKVEAEDLIIMFSDGICDASEDAPWLVELLKKADGEDIHRLAEDIISAASEHNPHRDDMTVLILKVKGLQN